MQWSSRITTRYLTFQDKQPLRISTERKSKDHTESQLLNHVCCCVVCRYKHLALRYHPFKNHSNMTTNTLKFNQVAEAFDVLYNSK